MRALLKLLVILSLNIGLLSSCSTDQPIQTGDVRQQIARAYGSDSFHQIEVIEYTFNVQIGDKHIQRSWVWWPRVEKVKFKSGSGQESMQYNRQSIPSSWRHHSGSAHRCLRTKHPEREV